MAKSSSPRHACTVCGRDFPFRDLVHGELIRPSVAQLIVADHPGWTLEGLVCREDLARYRSQAVRGLLESERGELTQLEREVIESLQQHEMLATNPEDPSEQQWTFGERVADKIASFGGSWPFLILFGCFLLVWIGVNSAALVWRPVDPFPFILLNLILSCLAAVQAPVIMMSQNRQDARDRLRSTHDYQVNLKAELEIRQLHEKLDHLLSHQWERLVEIQQMQLELLNELGRRR